MKALIKHCKIQSKIVSTLQLRFIKFTINEKLLTYRKLGNLRRSYLKRFWREIKPALLPTDRYFEFVASLPSQQSSTILYESKITSK